MRFLLAKQLAILALNYILIRFFFKKIFLPREILWLIFPFQPKLCDELNVSTLIEYLMVNGFRKSDSNYWTEMTNVIPKTALPGFFGHKTDV